ncbi:MAG: HAD-IIB family hydrolase [Methylocystaceae bacterium]|nr:HAD-IIB family hydrolase [Methylocystaceae bacterium]
MKVTKTAKLLVFTDLDGSLLDHETYSFSSAQSALDRLKSHHVPIILTTSKTYAEVVDLQKELGINDPCIVENGSAIYMGSSGFSQALAVGDAQIFGRSYQSICTFIEQLPKNIRVSLTGFADLSAQEVAQVTGLPIEKAEKAKNRLASEPFQWTGAPEGLRELEKLLDGQDMALLQGGRFYHIVSKVDKSLALDWLAKKAKSVYNAVDFHTVALGDGPNDEKMIASADTGIVIANPDGVALTIKGAFGKIKYPKAPGPAGWAQGMHELMDELGLA